MKKIAIILLAILLLAGFGYNFRADFLDFYSRVAQRLPAIEKASIDYLVQQIPGRFLAPPPLLLDKGSAQKEAVVPVVLTKSGVIRLTNDERIKNNLPALKENTKLDAAALSKAQDMVKNQYFEHVSPTGVQPADVVKNAGYEFILAGENLALGNFADNAALVKGWMDSPGHRANILNTRFMEIGVAVIKGSYQGQTVWFAVQEFGLPLSACPSPDGNLKANIEAGKNQLVLMEQVIEARRVEIESTQFSSRSEYIETVKQFNGLIAQYNDFISQTNLLVEKYRVQVDQFNACVR